MLVDLDEEADQEQKDQDGARQSRDQSTHYSVELELLELGEQVSIMLK